MTEGRRIGVAFVIVRLARGGAERILVSLANGLAPDRFNVHVITIQDAGELAGELAASVTVHVLDRHRPWDLTSFGRFRSILSDHSIGVVHTHSHLAAYFVALAYSRRSRSWLHVAHGHYPAISGSPLRWVDRLLLSRVDFWFTASDEIARYASNWLGVPSERCAILPNGIETSSLEEDSEPAGHGQGDTQVFTIIQVGRVTPQKSQLTAVAVAERLRTRVASFRWLIVGRNDSAYARRCSVEAKQAGLEGFMQFLGERADVGCLLRRAHVGVLTSKFEGLPLALLEYMAAGLAVVVTDVGDAGATVRNSGGGYAAAPGDIEAFIAALTEYASNPDAVAQAGRRNRAHVLKACSIDAMVRQVASVYVALTSAGGRTDGS